MGSTVVMKQDPQQKKLAPAEQPTTLFRRQGKKPHPSNAIPRIHTLSEKPLNTKNTNLIVRLEVTRQRQNRGAAQKHDHGSDTETQASRERDRIEQLEQTLTRLQAECDRYANLFDAVPVGYVLLDELGTIQETNQHFTEMVELQRDMLIRGPFMRLVLPDDVQVLLGHLRRCHFVTPGSAIVRLRAASGRVFPAELLTSRWSTGASPRIYFRIAVTDITHRQAAEQKQESTRQNFQTLIDTVEGVVWEADAATLDIGFVSQFAETLLGYPVQEWYRHGFWESHVYVEDRDQVMGLLSRPLAEGDELAMDYRVLTSKRDLLWLHERITVRRRGAKLRLFGIAVDITEHKRAEESLRYAHEHLESVVAERTAQLRETVSDMEAFSYSLSHDMRAPLRAMQGYAELLQERLAETLGATERDYFERIRGSAHRLDHLIQDVLQYSRIARAPVEIKPLQLEKVLEPVIHDYPALQEPNAEIAVEKPLLPVLGHEAFLTQCFSNLLSNAVKFVAEGQKPQVRIGTQPIGSDVRVWFQDNGIGIQKQDQKRIFGIFQRLHPAHRYQGTGIGLAIVQKAVERMGGRVGLESKVGEGTRFWLQLPRAQA